MTVGCVCRMVEFPVVRSPAGNPGNLRDNRCALLELTRVLEEGKRQGAQESDVSRARCTVHSMRVSGDGQSTLISYFDEIFSLICRAWGRDL